MNLELHKKYNYLKNHLNQNKMKVNYTQEQTSVEFFSDKVCEIIGWIPQTVDQAKALLEALEQAKEMEKEQIINAYNQGVYLAMKPSKRAEDYYDKTFKSE